MHIHFEWEGGFAYFPNLSKPIDRDTDHLEKDKVEKLKSYIEDSHFFQLDTSIGNKAKPAADYYSYNITIQEADRDKTVHVIEPVSDAALQRLIDYLFTLTHSWV